MRVNFETEIHNLVDLARTQSGEELEITLAQVAGIASAAQVMLESERGTVRALLGTSES